MNRQNGQNKAISRPTSNIDSVGVYPIISPKGLLTSGKVDHSLQKSKVRLKTLLNSRQESICDKSIYKDSGRPVSISQLKMDENQEISNLNPQ